MSQSDDEIIEGYSSRKIQSLGLNYDKGLFSFENRDKDDDIPGYISEK